MNNTDTTIIKENRIILSNYLPPPSNKETIKEIINGIYSSPRHIPSRFFYDDAGSHLFEKITRLPEYYPTRTEKEILKENAPAIAGNLSPLDIIELGSGDCSKISILFEVIPSGRRHEIGYIPVDVSRSAILRSAEALSRKFQEIKIHGMVADFYKNLTDIPGNKKKLICFFGSTIGNLDTNHTAKFLLNLKSVMKKGDQFLLGLDMVKDISVLEDAYNDTQGITAAFNKNILNVVNHYAKTDFDPRLFDHLAFFNVAESRIEMHLRASAGMVIHSPCFRGPLRIEKGEMIHTENSRKYTSKDFSGISGLTGLSVKEVYTDKRKWFSLIHFECL